MATTTPRLHLPGFGRRAERPAAHAQMSAGGKRLVGLVTALIGIVALILAFAPTVLPWNHEFRVKLQATAFGELDQRAWVDLGGTKIGQVTGLEGNDAIVDMDIQPQWAAKLHADASASIQPHGLLGPKYVELYPGHSGTFREGQTIPASRVHVATDFQEVVNTLQPDVRESLQVLLIELGQASQGRGTDVNVALAELGKASQDLTSATATVKGRDADLSQFLVAAEQFNRDVQNAPISASIADTDAALSGLAQVDQQLGDGVDQTAAVLAHLDVVVSGNQSNLSYTLARLPETVTRLRTVLAAGNTLLTGANAVDAKDGYSYNSIEGLMTAVMFTESAFAGKDAYGHFVRVYSLAGPCTTGLPSLPTGAQGGQCSGEPQNASGGQQFGAQPAPTSSLSDQQLVDLFLGAGGS